jgi:hypothetical protein
MRIAAAAGCAAFLLVGGCAERKARAYPWATAVLVRPHLPATAASDAGPAPDLLPMMPPPPSPLNAGRSGPWRPQTAASAAAERETPEKAAQPLLAPQLSEEETKASRQQTADSLDRAEHNLQAIRGRTLTAAQTDLASKVHSFVVEARSAASQGDWLRATALAKKAQVLSEELASSL